MFPLLANCGRVIDVGLGTDWSPATLAGEVSRRAAVLSQKGIGRRSVVAIGHSGTARFFADLFAVWTVGATAACLDTSLTPGELENIVTFANAALLLTDGGKSIDGLAVPVVELNDLYAEGATSANAVLNIDDPALLLFTSGTTGTPKGVVLTFGALLTRIKNNIEAIGTDTLSCALVSLPTFFGHGLIGNSLTPLSAGGTLVLHPLGLPLINRLGPVIDQYDVTFMSSVPSLWRLALPSSPKPQKRSLVRVHIGSAPLSAALWSEVADWTGAAVVNCYGITETANWIAGASSKDHIADGLVGTMWGGKAGVMDESGTIRDQGTGEIVIKSSCLMSGYYNRPDLTAAAFHDGYFRTGDQGLIDQDNRIWITGRIKDEINRGGFKVQPAELDALLESHPAVAEACVFGVPDAMGGEAVAAAVKLQKGESVSAPSLQSWCGQRLRRAAVPEQWFFVSEIPRNARGKVSRDNVRRLLTRNAEMGQASPEVAKPKQPSITIASTFVADPLYPSLRFALQKLGLQFDIRSAAYNQMFQELLSPTSLLATNKGGINVVLVRFEDMARGIDDLKQARSVLKSGMTRLQNALSDLVQRSDARMILVTLPATAPKALGPEVEEANAALCSFARSLTGVDLILPGAIDDSSSDDRYNKVGDEFAHIPFSEGYYASIALAVARKVRDLTRPDEQAVWPDALADGSLVLKAMRAGGAQSRSLPGQAVAPSTETERELVELWQVVLGAEGIGVEDDYFALGGTSLMAARIFTEVSRRFGQRLPLTAILESPTVRSLAARLEQARTTSEKALVELRPGAGRKIFFVHDGEGETLLYLNLARRLPDDLAATGVEPRRLPNMPVAHARIEDMASHYIREIRREQPSGPYLLAGMCAGGVIAYEMASQLLRAGETVELIALLDAPAPRTPKQTGRLTRQRLGRLKEVLEDSKHKQSGPAERVIAITRSIGRKMVNALIWETTRHGRNLSVRARFALLHELLSRKAAWPRLVPELTAHQILNCAQARYVPKPIAVRTILARATSGEGIDTPYAQIYSDGTLGWKAVADNLIVIDVEGGHSSMLQEAFVDSLAQALLPYVRAKPIEVGTLDRARGDVNF